MTRALIFRGPNGEQNYFVKDLSFFNVVCDLEDQGIDLMGMANEGGAGGRNMSAARAILAVLIGVSKERAGDIISDHLKYGGDMSVFNDIMDAFTENMKDSDFGQTQQNQQMNNSNF